MRDDIESALAFDPIAEAEGVTKKGHWSKFDSGDKMIAIMIGIESNAHKKDLLAQSNDTYFGMSWDYFVNRS